MASQDYWQMFLETGAPEFYLMYSKAQMMEKLNVFDSTGAGSQSHSL